VAYTGFGLVCQAKINLMMLCGQMWAEGRKGEDVMTVHQELDLAGRVGNGGNLGRALPPQTLLLFSKISRCRSPDACLHAVTHRQARGLHIATYRTRQTDGWQARGAGSHHPAHRGAYSPVGIIDIGFVFRRYIGPGWRSFLYFP
jgi:hypothetical protein